MVDKANYMDNLRKEVHTIATRVCLASRPGGCCMHVSVNCVRCLPYVIHELSQKIEQQSLLQLARMSDPCEAAGGLSFCAQHQYKLPEGSSQR